jgi:hypothetical protein
MTRVVSNAFVLEGLAVSNGLVFGSKEIVQRFRFCKSIVCILMPYDIRGLFLSLNQLSPPLSCRSQLLFLQLVHTVSELSHALQGSLNCILVRHSN